MMKIYILSDIEGVCGVTQKDQTSVIGGSYEKAREWLTLEINAAVQGAIDGGATDVLVVDGHGMNNACNIIVDKLSDGARYIQGAPWADYPPALDNSFDGLFQIGAHAMAGTRGAVLEHTMSTADWVEMRINGEPMGEIGLIAACAGDFGIPFVMVSGDDKACAEAASLVPNVECAEVKQGISRYSANMTSLPVAREIIYQKARKAMGELKNIRPLVLDSPSEIEVFYMRPLSADAVRERDGVRRVDGRRIRYTGRSVTEAFGRVRGAI